METTGHRSTSSVRSYKRMSDGQMRDISAVLSGNATCMSGPSNVAVTPIVPLNNPVNNASVGSPNIEKPKCQANSENVKQEGVSLNGLGNKAVCLNFTVNITK